MADVYFYILSRSNQIGKQILGHSLVVYIYLQKKKGLN